jgi:NADPH-dependent F420 reductase
MSTKTRIAVIGKGNVGGNLGARFSNAGFPVRFGVRTGSKDQDGLRELLARCGKDASASEPREAVAWAEVVFLAVPGSAAVEVARSLAKELAGKVVVDCNNPVTWKEGPVWAPPAEGSLAAAIAHAAPGARVVKGFNTFGAEFHGDPTLPGGGADVYLAGDDAAAKALVSEVAKTAGFTPVDAGPLRNAGVVENVAILWIHLAMVGGHGRTFAFKMTKRA